MIYFIILVVLIIPVIIYDIAGIKRGINIWYVFEFLILVLLAGLRYRVGGDTLFYMSFFDSYPKLNELSYFDFLSAEFSPLWYVFNAIVKFIHDDFVIFQIIQAIIVNSVFFWFFRKYTKYYFSAILMYYFGYYCYFNMEIIRQVLAICFFLLAIPALNKRKYLMYYFWCIVALFFHYSALFVFFIPIFLVVFKSITYKQLILISIIIGVLISVINIIPFLLSLFSFNELIAFKLENYTASSVSIKNILFFYGNIIPIIILLYLNKSNEILLEINQFKGIIIMYAILMIFSAFYHTVFTRLSYFLTPFYIIYLIEYLYYFVKKNRLSLQTIFVKFALFVVLFFQSYYYLRDQSEYYPNARFYYIFYPYYSVFNPTIDEDRENFLSNLRNAEGF